MVTDVVCTGILINQFASEEAIACINLQVSHFPRMGWSGVASVSESLLQLWLILF